MLRAAVALAPVPRILAYTDANKWNVKSSPKRNAIYGALKKTDSTGDRKADYCANVW
jgi:hypothetical protein